MSQPPNKSPEPTPVAPLVSAIAGGRFWFGVAQLWSLGIMSPGILIAIIVLLVVGTTLKRYNRKRFLLNRRAQTPKSAKIVALEHEREEMRRDFIALGLRPFQVVLGISFWLFVISVFGQVWYNWPQMHLWRALIAIAFFSLLWWFQFQYRRICFSTLAFAIAATLLSSIGHLTANIFFVTGFLARIIVVVASLIIYTKMKPSTLSKRDA